MSPEDLPEEAWQYVQNVHKMRMLTQLGEQLGFGDTDPVEVRTAVNATSAGLAALVSLLVSKGVITKEEYFTLLGHMTDHCVDQMAARITEMEAVKAWNAPK